MICCICKEEIEIQVSGWSYGHNPFPVMANQSSKDRCCDLCNSEVVIPVRMNRILTDFVSRKGDGSQN